MIEPSNRTIYENFTIGDVLTTLKGDDNDKGNNGDNTLTYHLISEKTENHENTSELFKINQNTGDISTISYLDADEGVTKHILVVKVQDAGISTFVKSATATVIYTLKDYNEFTPKFEHLFYQQNVTEEVSIGTTVLSLTATDSDATANYAFRSESFLS